MIFIRSDERLALLSQADLWRRLMSWDFKRFLPRAPHPMCELMRGDDKRLKCELCPVAKVTGAHLCERTSMHDALRARRFETESRWKQLAEEYVNLMEAIAEGGPVVFAQFYSRRGQETVGSLQVAVLNGRHNLETQAMIARSLCQVRGFVGFDIRKGESFTRAEVIRKVEYPK